MEMYIGTKMVYAEPAYRCSNDGFKNIITPDAKEAFCNFSTVEDGYKVVYADGYESWSPKEIFEKAYLKVEVNPDLRTARPSISEQMVDDFILEKEVRTMGDKTTVVRVMLRNGFEIVESSSCVSPENYDEELGTKICLKKIKDKVWMLLGFLLQTAVNGIV